HHRVLASFPTRRSSDLAGAIVVGAVAVAGAAQHAIGTSRTPVAAAIGVALVQWPPASVQTGGMAQWPPLQAFPGPHGVKSGLPRSEEHTSELQSPDHPV